VIIEPATAITVERAYTEESINGADRVGLLCGEQSLRYTFISTLLDSSSTLHYLSKNKREDST